MYKKPHYYYRTPLMSEVGVKLSSFVARCDDASEQARVWAEKHGADHYYESPAGMAGGIAFVEFDNTLSKEGWDMAASPVGHVFFFPKEGSELERQMYALPIVSEMELVSILHLLPSIGRDKKVLPFTFGNETPVIFRHADYWYVDVPYKTESCEPITRRRFERRRRVISESSL